MVNTGVIDVKGTSPTGYIVKIGMRLLHGIVNGFAFEFSDGSKVNLSAHGGGNTDPYNTYINFALKTIWILIPDGCDEIKIHDFNNNGHDGKIRQMYVYKNGMQIGSMNGGVYCGGTCAPGYTISCPEGQLISLIRVTIPVTTYWQSFIFNIAHGTPDPNPKPRNGGWSPWSTYDVCSKECGPGLKKRTRRCDNPVPIRGGMPCIGASSESNDCNIGDCPQNGGWGEWGDWGDCEGDCSVGAGIHSRTRRCDNPVPIRGGMPCIGASSESNDCNIGDCPQNGGWGEWGDWSAYTDSVQQRSRQCNKPLPSNGGNECVGDSIDTRMYSIPTHTTTEVITDASGNVDPGSGISYVEKTWVEKNMVVILIVLIITVGFFISSKSSVKTDITGGTGFDGTADEVWHGGLESYATVGYGGIGSESI
jgi:hypothetical protein